jgi:hypothetical protein
MVLGMEFFTQNRFDLKWVKMAFVWLLRVWAMRDRIWRLGIVVFLVAVGSGMLWSCGQKEPPLKAKVEVAHKSIYVWNKGDQAWTGGKVFLNDPSQNISRPMGTVTPGGFGQFPIREFRQGGKSVLESGMEITSVCVEVEGYATAKFQISWKGK